MLIHKSEYQNAFALKRRLTMKRCHCALEQAKHFEDNGEQRLESSSPFPIMSFLACIIYAAVSERRLLMKCFSCLVGGLVFFPRYLQLQSPLWTGDWEPELPSKQDENKTNQNEEVWKYIF